MDPRNGSIYNLDAINMNMTYLDPAKLVEHRKAGNIWFYAEDEGVITLDEGQIPDQWFVITTAQFGGCWKREKRRGVAEGINNDGRIVYMHYDYSMRSILLPGFFTMIPACNIINCCMTHRTY